MYQMRRHDDLCNARATSVLYNRKRCHTSKDKLSPLLGRSPTTRQNYRVRGFIENIGLPGAKKNCQTALALGARELRIFKRAIFPPIQARKRCGCCQPCPGRNGASGNTLSEAHRRIWQSRSYRESGNVEGISLRAGSGAEWGNAERGGGLGCGLKGRRGARGQPRGGGRGRGGGGGAAPHQPERSPSPTPEPRGQPRASHPLQLPQAASPPRRRLLPEQKLCVSNGNRAARQLPPPPPPPPAPISANPAPPAGKGLRVYRGSRTPSLPP